MAKQCTVEYLLKIPFLRHDEHKCIVVMFGYNVKLVLNLCDHACVFRRFSKCGKVTDSIGCKKATAGYNQFKF